MKLIKNINYLNLSLIKLKKDKNFQLIFFKALNIMKASILNSGKIIFAGNGGSAADAQHLNAELTGKYLKNRAPIPSISITTDTSVLTSISNDSDYKKVFSRQLESIANKNDIFFAITTSGKSKNILESLKFCKKRNIKSICLTKKNYPKILNKYADIILGVPAKRVDRVQEMHIFIGHNLCEELEKALR